MSTAFNQQLSFILQNSDLIAMHIMHTILYIAFLSFFSFYIVK